eukprot:CAMPEP_0197072300 /NCGR_PEP_ID=MMETSP1384-20130603/210028_1 /TAXON_ID=29189 /ORGANISM="Ammonia sp." /LENGTH=312 /DNA_ID=CAMNT_0042511117 /DNA_START=76 /DNA_END=1015 /DNA_ORIENTATION=-
MISVILALCVGIAAAAVVPVPVYRYWASSIGDHFYTTSYSELYGGNGVYTYEGIGFYVASSKCESNTPLFRYYQPTRYDHFYTTTASEIGTTTAGVSGNYGYISEGVLGYCNPAATAGEDMVPLYRYWNSVIADHFYTISWSELGAGAGNWNYEGIQCYVYSSATAAREEQNVAQTDDWFAKEMDGDSFDEEKVAAGFELFGEVEHMPFHSLQAESGKAMAANSWLLIFAVVAVVLLVVIRMVYQKKQCGQKKGERAYAFPSLQGESGKAMAANSWLLIFAVVAVVLLVVIRMVYQKKQCGQKKGDEYAPLV